MNLTEAAKILNIEPTATKEQVHTAYKKMTKLYHPDLHPNDENAKDMMQSINAANMVFQKHFLEQNKNVQKPAEPVKDETKFANPAFNKHLDELWQQYLDNKQAWRNQLDNVTIPAFKSVTTIETKLAAARLQYSRNPAPDIEANIKTLTERLVFARTKHTMALNTSHLLKNQMDLSLAFYQQNLNLIKGSAKQAA